MNDDVKERLMKTKNTEEFWQIIKEEYPGDKLSMYFLWEELGKDVFGHLTKLIFRYNPE
ncbi:hypothetical protein Tfer_2568 [Thermincola ferriacetica]|uniref:Uncharacterized protein n=2 Tax=Thermincola TaxID=278993 RepID=D5XAV7_THEPJ|nr:MULTISPECIES: hypothetical protein [Thermincola]ADG83311.1 hypothetical protein TherJR_2472 [Thermincola potens JR]KNZ68845.1 hypothetical protein Tfer_2568 [Thermincola ferriacetica]